MDTPQASTSVQISPQPAVVSPAEFPNRRWILWSAIGLTFLIFGIVVGVFSAKFLNQSQSRSQLALTPTPTLSPTPSLVPDPTANWKTYTNSKHDFKFEYPSDWKQNGPISNDDQTIVYLHAPDTSGKTPQLAYYIYLSITDKLPVYIEGVYPDIEYEKITINGYQSFKTDKLPSRLGSLTFWLTRDQKNFIGISLTPYDVDNPWNPNQEEYIKLFDQILSTFKFLD